MIILSIFYDNDKQQSVLDALLCLPDTVKPLTFSSTEGKNLPDNKVVDTKKFNNFKKKNLCGFFMHANEAIYNLTISSSGISSVFIEFCNSISNDLIQDYFLTFSKIGIDFGFVCDNSEYLHRNLHFFKLGSNKIETWVGRNLLKYVSGLYWQTYISINIAKKHSIKLEKVCSLAKDVTRFEKGILVNFFNDPQEWEIHAEQLDNFCSILGGVFSKKDVDTSVSTDMNFIELNSVLSRWR